MNISTSGGLIYSGHNLDLFMCLTIKCYSVKKYFAKIMQSFILMQNTWKEIEQGVRKFLVPFFFEKKNLFLPISDTALIFRLGPDTGIVSLLFTFHSNLYIFEIIFYSIAMKLLHFNTQFVGYHQVRYIQVLKNNCYIAIQILLVFMLRWSFFSI